MEEMLDSENLEDQKWAVEQCAKGFARMIPLEVGGEGGKPIPIQIIDFTTYKPKVITD